MRTSSITAAKTTACAAGKPYVGHHSRENGRRWRLCHADRVFRLLELLGGLSLVTDIGTGSPLEESLKRCLVATRLARISGCTEPEVSDVLYTALLQHLGCTAYAHEMARVWGDDIVTARVSFLSDSGELADMWRVWIPGIAKATGRSKARVLATTVVTARRKEEATAATCEVARGAAQGLGLPEPVQAGLSHMFAMWNGKGLPSTAGEAIPLTARLMQVAFTAVMFTVHANTDVALAEVRRRAGGQLDPDLADLLIERADELLDDLDEVDAYQAVLDAEPEPVRRIEKDELADVARTFGNLVDLKSPSLRGHSAGVGDLAAAAIGMLGLREEIETVRVAGYLHDLGRVGVSSAIWEKPGPLSTAERDQARLHAYHSERILARIAPLAELAKLAGQHHEHCDGSGYHRGFTAAQLSMPSRVLACADTYRRLIEDRPYRRALAPARAADRLEAEARAGRLDADAAAAVIEAAGLPHGTRRARPADLTERQVEVLRLVSLGLSNAEIAERLVLSRRTVEHHVQDIYLKIGASTRAGAAMFAMQHGLL
jgi:HD-GYP domain-containing protein (c-di-GMP phosphodiesterase class II)/DNA-binding CsgD family transcriptional regulator